MGDNTPPTFELLDKFPTEIRSMIFSHTIRNIGEDQPILYDHYGIPWPPHEAWDTQGLRIADAKAHLTSSHWILLNKSYCSEHLRAFVKEVGLSACFTSRSAPPYYKASLRVTEKPVKMTEPKQVLEVLRLITHRYNAAIPHAGIDTSSTTLLSRIKSISLSYHYYGTVFERGFVKTDRRQFPYGDFLVSPLEILRQYHDDYDIPAERLFIHINYGDPTWTIVACINTIDYERRGFDEPFFSLDPIEVPIHVNDCAASLTAIDNKLETLRKTVQEILQKLGAKYTESHSHLSKLEDMINRDMASLRRRHLRAIDEVTKFWRARDEQVDSDETFGIPE